VSDKIETIIDSLKVTGAKGDFCPGSFMSTGANSSVAPVESAPMSRNKIEIRKRYDTKGEFNVVD